MLSHIQDWEDITFVDINMSFLLSPNLFDEFKKEIIKYHKKNFKSSPKINPKKPINQ